MTTSGNPINTTSRNSIIRAAALNVSAIARNETMSAETVTDFAFMLNSMIKHWQGRGIKVWTVTEGALFPVAGQVRYGAGSGATDHITANHVLTTLGADVAAADTVLTLNDTSSIAAADHIGIALDDGTVRWTTVVSKTSTTATITAALTGSAAFGNTVVTYTSRIPKPIRIVAARRYDIAADSEPPVNILSRQEYQSLTTKNQSGTITQVYYDPQLNIGYFHLWNVPSTFTQFLKFTFWRPFDIFSVGGDTPDLPEEWGNTMIWNLSEQMLVRFPVSPQRINMIRERAAQTLSDMEGFAREAEPIFFMPSFTGR